MTINTKNLASLERNGNKQQRDLQNLHICSLELNSALHRYVEGIQRNGVLLSSNNCLQNLHIWKWLGWVGVNKVEYDGLILN